MNLGLLGYCVLAMVAMGAQDTLGSFMIVAIDKNRGRLAGAMDGLGDFASKYGGCLMAGSVIKWGLGSWETFIIVATTGVTSFFCTSQTTELAHRMLGKPDKLPPVGPHLNRFRDL
jgi:hypothetical protein